MAASCVEFLLEIEAHRYQITKQLNDERDLKQEASRARCHLIDCLRYLATSPAVYSDSLAS